MYPDSGERLGRRAARKVQRSHRAGCARDAGGRRIGMLRGYRRGGSGRGAAGATSRIGGGVSWQRGSARGQRVVKAQPWGGFRSEGGSPGRAS